MENVIKNDSNIYIRNGFKNRKDYLTNLAMDFDIPLKIVLSMASILGENEDFDGLVSSLEDFDYDTIDEWI